MEFSKYRKWVSSTDRLRHVQDIEHHIQNKNIGSYSSEFLPPPADDSDILLISDCIASILSCDKKIWLCTGEVNGLKFDGKSVPYINLDILSEEAVTVSYQVLGLRPTTLNDDPDGIHDWRTYRMDERLFTVPGRLVQPINPKISTTHATIPWYLLQGTFLVTLARVFFKN